jgi:hypothetical protein
MAGQMVTCQSQALGCGVVIPVGPGDVDRFKDLTDSLFAFEHDVRVLVAIDDSSDRVRLESLIAVPDCCKFIVIKNPRKSKGDGRLGGMCVAVLSALQKIHDLGCYDFVLKIDTDSLIIRRFGPAVRRFLSGHPSAGLIGTLGRTCRREEPDYGHENRIKPRLMSYLADITDKVLSQAASGITEFKLEWAGIVERQDILGLALLRKHLSKAMDEGYRWLEYCQGGAYVLASETLHRMSTAGYLDNPMNWLHVPIAEDVMMGMYTRAVGLLVRDYSRPGEPFGVHYRGLAYSLSKMVSQRYSVIHSLKNDPRYSEQRIRAYFRDKRNVK